MGFRTMSLFSEDIIRKLENYCSSHKLDLATFKKLCEISLDEELRSHVEKVALAAELFLLAKGQTKKAETAFFAALLYYDTDSGTFPDNVFCEKKIIKTYVDTLLKKCTTGNIFMAYCIRLQRKLRSKKYLITIRDLPAVFSVEERKKILQHMIEIEAIIKICEKNIFGAKEVMAVDFK